MSITSPDATLSTASLGSSSLPVVNQASIPADIRNGNAAAKAAYDEGLEFAQVLVNQLAKQLEATVSSDPSSDGSDSSDSSGEDSSTGLLGSSSSSPYASLIPQALSQSIMSGGGLGIPAEIAQSIDPSIGDKK